MLDKIAAFATRNQVTTAVAAALGAIALYAAFDRGNAVSPPGGASGGPEGGQAGPARQGGGQHEVIDRQGFDRPVRAMTISVPSGWQARSEVRWDNVNGQCSTNIASPAILMRSGDGREQIEILPGFLVTTQEQVIRGRGSQPGDFCVLALADSGEALIRTVIAPRLRAGARIERINSIPLTPQQQSLQAQLRQLAQSSGGSMRPTVYSLEARLSHPDGTAEALAISGFILASPQLIAGVPPYVSNHNDVVISVRSSPDRLPALMQTARGVIAGAQFNPEWKAHVEETQRVLTRPAQPGPRVAGRGGGGGGGSGGGFDMDRWREDQRRDDGVQRDRIDAIREVERCYDPETGRSYEVSIHVGC